MQRDKLLISVIVPTYNSEKTIEKCLSSIFSSTFKEIEVIVVDDCSVDSTCDIVSKFGCELVKLEKNSGPAVARNRGARSAGGDILFFADSDVILKKDALSITHEFYRKKPDAVCMIGMYAKEPANKGWFNYYMAYWKYYTWTNPLPKYFTFFIASCGSIKRRVFLDLGGFNTKYKGADVEDFDFGYRLTKNHKIYFIPEIQGYHYFPQFKSCVKNYFRRSLQWFDMFIKRRKFDSGAASASRGVSFSFATVSLIFLLLMFVVSNIYTISLFILFIAAYALINLKFYTLVLSEKGILFFFYSFLITYFLALAVSFGAAASFVRYISRWSQ